MVGEWVGGLVPGWVPVTRERDQGHGQTAQTDGAGWQEGRRAVGQGGRGGLADLDPDAEMD